MGGGPGPEPTPLPPRPRPCSCPLAPSALGAQPAVLRESPAASHLALCTCPSRASAADPPCGLLLPLSSFGPLLGCHLPSEIFLADPTPSSPATLSDSPPGPCIPAHLGLSRVADVQRLVLLVRVSLRHQDRGSALPKPLSTFVLLSCVSVEWSWDSACRVPSPVISTQQAVGAGQGPVK